MHEKKLLSMATGEGGVNERWLWHGTGTLEGLDPCVICRSIDGFDLRMVCGVGGRIAMYGCGCGRAHVRVPWSVCAVPCCVCCGGSLGSDCMVEAPTSRNELCTHTPATATELREVQGSSFLRAICVAAVWKWGRPLTQRW